MTERRPRYRTGSPDIDRQIGQLLDAIGVTADRELLFEIFVTDALLAGDARRHARPQDHRAALREMREAFRTFAAYHDSPRSRSSARRA